jgi:lipopolysaccharide transport system permease protein
MQMAAYVILIDVMLNAGTRRFPLFILTSVLAWKYFSAGVRNAIVLTISKEGHMRQIAFPKVVLPLATILAETVRFGFGLAVVLVAAVGWQRYPTAETPYLLIVIAVQLVFTLALAILFSALNFYLRDVLNFVTYLFPIWFYLSPGLYDLDRVPQHYLSLYLLNPFATILPAYHAILLEHAGPNFERLGIVGGISLLLLFGAYMIFVRLQSSFAKVN